MRYIKLRIISFLAVILFFSTVKAQFINCERQYTVPFSPLLQKIHSLNDFNGNADLGVSARILPLGGTSFAPNGQELIKHNGKIYIMLKQTGFIFQMLEPKLDSVVFKRIDNTININYNISCTNFIYKDQIFNYGVYGFWNKNGHLRKFNTADLEWDIQPTNIEVVPSDYEWFSQKQGRLYMPFQKIEKVWLKGAENKNGIFDYTSYYLDIKTADWIKLGKLSKELIKIVNQRNNYIYYPHDNGRIFVINDEAYFFDYIQNKVYKSKKADFSQFLVRNGGDMTIFYYQEKFYKYQSASQTFKTWDFNLADFQELAFPIWGADYTNWFIGLATFLAILTLIVFAWIINRRIKNKIEKAQLKVLKTKSINQAFTEIETSLIQLLLKAHEANQHVEINAINHVLGIKDKNIGLQKKVRSDIINAVNDKYVFITQGESILIGSARKEDDKRYFEYFIVPTEVSTVQKLIQ